MVRSQQEVWQGPLPSPKTMEEYRNLAPDWPERIIQQWEAETDHRRRYETTALKAATRQDLLGQVLAGAFSIGALLLSAFALWMNAPWVAVLLGGGTIASVVWAFLHRSQPPK